MYRFLWSAIVLMVCSAGVIQAQQGRKAVSVFGSYNTSASMFLNPSAVDPEVRNRAFEFEDIFNPGLEFKYYLSDELVVGLSLEYIRRTEQARNVTVQIDKVTQRVAMTDGFAVLPLELTIYYVLPFSTELFNFYMGGGIGHYFGSHIREIGSLEGSTVSQDASFGLHVGVGTEFFISNTTSVSLAMKFRDPELDLENEYDAENGTWNGQSLWVGRNDFPSRINLDGVVFHLGASYYF